MMPADPAVHALLDDAYGDDAERALRAAEALREMLADRVIAAASEEQRRRHAAGEAARLNAAALLQADIDRINAKYGPLVGRTHIGRLARRVTEGDR